MTLQPRAATPHPGQVLHGSFNSVSLYHNGAWTSVTPQRMRVLVTLKSKAAAVSRAASLRARAELGLLLLFLRYHAVTFRGGHGAWGRVLSDMGLNYNTARRAVEAAVLFADKSLVAGRAVGGGQQKLPPVCDASILAEAASWAYPEAFSGKASQLDAERTAWHNAMVQGRAAARLVGSDAVKQRAVTTIAEWIKDLPLWVEAAEAKLSRGGMDAATSAKVVKALEVLRAAVGEKEQRGVADVRGARTA